jgi:hypothetical protein
MPAAVIRRLLQIFTNTVLFLINTVPFLNINQRFHGGGFRKNDLTGEDWGFGKPRRHGIKDSAFLEGY